MEKLRKLQIVEYHILCDIAKICDEHNLKYYLIGGTLLGAVRHQGFIPWDDDVDLVMFRKDYEKLFSIIQDEYSQKFFAQRFETDKNYTRYIMKIRLNGTKHVEEENKSIQMHQGIYVDIFPLDFVICDKKKLVKRGRKLRRLFAYKNIKHNSFFSDKKKRLISFLLKPIFIFIPDKVLNKSFKKVCEYDSGKECNYVTNFASHFKWEKQLFPANYYGDGVYLKFEKSTFRCPLKYKEILSRLYGKDYMDIPPFEKREQHKIIQVDFGEYDEQNIE